MVLLAVEGEMYFQKIIHHRDKRWSSCMWLSLLVY